MTYSRFEMKWCGGRAVDLRFKSPPKVAFELAHSRVTCGRRDLDMVYCVKTPQPSFEPWNRFISILKFVMAFGI